MSNDITVFGFSVSDIPFLNAIVKSGAVDRTATPPGGPSAGDLYILTGSPSGAWSSASADDLALYTSSGWLFFTPAAANEGLSVYVQDENLSYLWNGSSWVAGGTYLENVSEDTTPQLGGDLDVNGNSIVSTSDGDITLTPNGTGNVVIGGDSELQILGSTGDVGYLAFFYSDADPGADVTITFTGDGDDVDAILDFSNADGNEYVFPSTDGTLLTEIVQDTTPQLGGDLDVNGNSIVSTSNGNVTVDPNGTGLLHVILESGTTPSFSTGAIAVFQNNDDTDDDCIVSILAGDAGNSILQFGDDVSINPGYINYDHNGDSYSLVVGGTSVYSQTTTKASFTGLFDADLGTNNLTTNGFRIHGTASESAQLTIDNTGSGGRQFKIISTNSFSGLGSNSLVFYDDTSNDVRIIIDNGGHVGVGADFSDPDYTLDVDGEICTRELSADPSDPDEGATVVWMGDGTGTGDDGDVYAKTTAASTTKTIPIIDFSLGRLAAPMQPLTFTAQDFNTGGLSSGFAMPTWRNGHQVYAFDDSTDESCYVMAYLPYSYSGGGLTIGIEWLAETATSGNVIWNIEIERHERDTLDLDSDSFAAANTVTDAAPGTSGHVTQAQITFTDGADMDSWAAGEWARIKITRDADNGSDTMSDDAQLIGLVISETF